MRSLRRWALPATVLVVSFFLDARPVANATTLQGSCHRCSPAVIAGQETWLCLGGFEDGGDHCRIASTCVEVGTCP